MKRLLLLLLIIPAFISLKSQPPQAFNYQAVVRDKSGNLHSNKQLDVKISILSQSKAGEVIYEEKFDCETDNFGVLSLMIGNGVPVLSKFTSINWSSGNYFLRMSYQLSGTSGYTDMEPVKLLSFPYALYAEKSGEKHDLTLDKGILSIVGGGAGVKLPTGDTYDPIWTENSLGVAYREGGISLRKNHSPFFEVQTDLYGNGAVNVYSVNRLKATLFTEGISGNLTLKGSSDTKKVELKVLEEAGHLHLYGANGIKNLGIGGGDGKNNTGGVWTYDEEGNYLIKMSALEDKPSNPGIGFYQKGKERALLYVPINKNAGELSLSGSNDKVVVLAGKGNAANSGGKIGTYDVNGNVKTILETNTNNAGNLHLLGDNGNSNIYLGNLNNYPNLGGLWLKNESGNDRVRLLTNTDDTGNLYLYGANGSSNVVVGNPTAYPNVGGVWTRDSNENDIIRITSLIDYPNYPSISLHLNGVPKGHFYITPNGKSRLVVDEILDNDGYSLLSEVISYTTPNLRSNSQTSSFYILNANGQITIRGTSSLMNGNVKVNLPEDITEQINEHTITVLVTPLSAESQGLAVISKSNSDFEVSELNSGSGSYDFDWTFTALVKESPQLKSNIHVGTNEAATVSDENLLKDHPYGFEK